MTLNEQKFRWHGKFGLSFEQHSTNGTEKKLIILSSDRKFRIFFRLFVYLFEHCIVD